MSTTFVHAPKETDSVLLRIPSALKSEAVSIAEQNNVSANALYAAGVLHATVIYGVLPRMGPPRHLLKLIKELDPACSETRRALGGFDHADWDEIRWLVERLADIGWVKDVQVRTDIGAASTIVYSLEFTKLGRSMWPALSQSIVSAVKDIVQPPANDIMPA